MTAFENLSDFFDSFFNAFHGEPTFGNPWPVPRDVELLIIQTERQRLQFAERNRITLDRMSIHALNAILKAGR